jgi:hypothetical protein
MWNYSQRQFICEILNKQIKIVKIRTMLTKIFFYDLEKIYWQKNFFMKRSLKFDKNLCFLGSLEGNYIGSDVWLFM